jgi:hypothetical protein
LGEVSGVIVEELAELRHLLLLVVGLEQHPASSSVSSAKIGMSPPKRTASAIAPEGDEM